MGIEAKKYLNIIHSKSENEKHIESVHDRDKKNSCHHCEYKATAKGHLKRHIESVHMNVDYPCNQCEYKATQLRHDDFSPYITTVLMLILNISVINVIKFLWRQYNLNFM